jgi:hypothetical protein
VKRNGLRSRFFHLLVNRGEDLAYIFIFLVVRTELAVGAVAEYLDPAEAFVLPCPGQTAGTLLSVLYELSSLSATAVGLEASSPLTIQSRFLPEWAFNLSKNSSVGALWPFSYFDS